MIELVLLLLPLAAASGWLAAKQSGGGRDKARAKEYNPAYFKGLNYVLNEQPDKAIDVFVKLLEVDKDTVETHFLLANLFRRRGEVDRAIRIHQNLIARTTLDSEQRSLALLELGKDYMRAGLFDRAESLFQELTELNQHATPALAHLKTIYQQERDWKRALDVAAKLEKSTGKSEQMDIAHYYCELAEEALARGVSDEAKALMEQARAADATCVRATILIAEQAAREGQCPTALANYQRVEDEDPEYLPDILPQLLQCYRDSGRQAEIRPYLEGLYKQLDTGGLLLALAEAIETDEGPRAAADFLLSQLRSSSDFAGAMRLIDLNLKHEEASIRHDTLRVLRDLMAAAMERQPTHQCGRCGFAATKLHWQCPGCKAWASIKPVRNSVGQQQTA